MFADNTKKSIHLIAMGGCPRIFYKQNKKKKVDLLGKYLNINKRQKEIRFRTLHWNREGAVLYGYWQSGMTTVLQDIL